MKLGTQTASVMNHLYSRMTIGQPDVEVGMGCTILGWTDRDAGTIISVQKTKTTTIIGVQRDKSVVVSGSSHDGSADYEFQPNPKAVIKHFRLNKTGRWDSVCFNEETKRWVATGGSGLRIGERDTYRDPSF